MWGDHVLQNVIGLLINLRKQLDFSGLKFCQVNSKELVTLWYKVMHVLLCYSGPFNKLLIPIQ